jgi:hypothetical protein
VYGGARQEEPSPGTGAGPTAGERSGSGATRPEDVPVAEDPAQVGGFGEAIAYAAKPGATGAGGGPRGTDDDTRRSG